MIHKDLKKFYEENSVRKFKASILTLTFDGKMELRLVTYRIID